MPAARFTLTVMDEVRVSGLFVYPVKGCRGLALDAARVGDRGFVHDREWMVVGPDGGFLSQRTHPRMALAEVALTDELLVVRAPGMADLVLPLGGGGAARRPVTIWRDTVEAVSAGPAAAAWFSAFLGLDCELVRMPATTHRQVEPNRARPGDLVGFADAYPFLLISQGSLDELNRRLCEPLPMDRFRPNLVVDGCAPHTEDGWRTFAVGTVTFRVAKPCARCVVTTVDQRTGERADEPLGTLATYRLRDGKLLFGQNLIHDGRGMLCLGDRCVVEPLT